VKLFDRFSILEEILTDQGNNFTSQLLAEIYRLLHVKSLRTSPYHPQTDGWPCRKVEPNPEGDAAKQCKRGKKGLG